MSMKHSWRIPIKLAWGVLNLVVAARLFRLHICVPSQLPSASASSPEPCRPSLELFFLDSSPLVRYYWGNFFPERLNFSGLPPQEEVLRNTLRVRLAEEGGDSQCFIALSSLPWEKLC